MKTKSQFTTPQLRTLQRQGLDIVPVFGRPLNQPPATHFPRTKFDPKPWTIDGYRYSAWELTAEPHRATAAELIEQHYYTTDGYPGDN